jgi:hypothetical protein
MDPSKCTIQCKQKRAWLYCNHYLVKKKKKKKNSRSKDPV